MGQKTDHDDQYMYDLMLIELRSFSGFQLAHSICGASDAGGFSVFAVEFAHLQIAYTEE
jgi:hypothetical protein